MTMRMGILLEANGKQAKVEISSVAKTAGDLEKELKKISVSGKSADSSISDLAKEARNAAAAFKILEAANDKSVEDAQDIKHSHDIAAGSVANLTSQFNDIGVMMMAGQNPLQLAVQQGTQISQVLGPMGARGAIRALGPALMSMVSPISLITIGSIAAGAAITQWLTGASEQSQTARENIDDLAQSIKDYAEANEAAEQSSFELEEQFGALAGRANDLLTKIAETKREALNIKLRATISTIVDEADIDLPKWDIGDQTNLANFFDVSDWAFAFGAQRDEIRPIINTLLGSYTDLADAADGSIDDQISALERLIEYFRKASELSGGISGAENSRLADYEQLLLQLYEQRGPELPDIDAQIARQREAWAQYYAMRIKGEAQLKAATEEAALIASHQVYDDTRAQSNEELAKAQAMLATAKERAEMQKLITTYGEDSVAVANLRADADRRALNEELAQLDVSEALKEEIRQSLEAALGLANVDVASNLSAAADQARRVGDELMRALEASMALSAQGTVSLRQSELRLEHANDPVALAGALARDRMVSAQGKRREGVEGGELVALDAEVEAYARNMEAIARNDQARLAAIRKNTNSRSRSSGGSSNRNSQAKETQRERDNVIKLIDRLKDERDLLREADPVQKELLRNRKTLASATEAERDEIEKLIATRLDEEAALAQLTERQEFFNDIAYDALDALILGGESAKDVIDNLTDALAKAALKALLLGQGPLAGLFGTSGDGGIIGMIGSIFAPGKADGGEVEAAEGILHGIGGGRDDKILHWLSAGEFVVNASATARNRALLEAVNSNAPLPGLAMGGLVGGGASQSPAPAVSAGTPDRSIVEILPSPLFDAHVRKEAEGTTVKALKNYDKAVLPKSVKRIQQDPRRVG